MKNFFDVKLVLILFLTVILYLLYKETLKLNTRINKIEMTFDEIIEITETHIDKPVNNPVNEPVNEFMKENLLHNNQNIILDPLNGNNFINNNLFNYDSSNFNLQNKPDILNETTSFQPDRNNYNISSNNNSNLNNSTEDNSNENNSNENNSNENNSNENNSNENNSNENNSNLNNSNEDNYNDDSFTDSTISEINQIDDNNIIDNSTLEEFSNETDRNTDNNENSENNDEMSQIYSNDNDEENHTSAIESLEDMTSNIISLDITTLLKNNKLGELQKMAELLDIEVKHNDGKRKTKLTLAQDIINKKNI